jgi:hypothetical protein
MLDKTAKPSGPVSKSTADTVMDALKLGYKKDLVEDNVEALLAEAEHSVLACPSSNHLGSDWDRFNGGLASSDC